MICYQNACSSNPCFAGATCQTGFTEKGYRCLCPAGSFGDHCEKGLLNYLYFMCVLLGHKSLNNLQLKLPKIRRFPNDPRTSEDVRTISEGLQFISDSLQKIAEDYPISSSHQFFPVCAVNTKSHVSSKLLITLVF